MRQMRGLALGLIETRGYVPLVLAVDGALKAAQVVLTSKTLVGGGLVNATVRGDVGAVRAALEAAAAIIKQMGADGMTHVIARPDAAVWALLARDGLRLSDPPEPGGSSAPPMLKPEAELPVARAEPELPVLKPETEVPAAKPEAGLPVVQKKAGEQAEPKAPAKPKKPRKPAKK